MYSFAAVTTSAALLKGGATVTILHLGGFIHIDEVRLRYNPALYGLHKRGTKYLLKTDAWWHKCAPANGYLDCVLPDQQMLIILLRMKNLHLYSMKAH